MTLGPLPIKSKQSRLDLGIKIMQNKPNFSKLNDYIISILKEKACTKLDLSEKLKVNRKTIGERLNKLEKRGLVKRTDRKGGKGASIIWAYSYH